MVSMKTLTLGLMGCATALLIGCAGATPGAVTPGNAAGNSTNSTAQTPGGPVVEVAPVVVSPYSEAELAKEFERARGLLMQDKFAEAMPIFDKIVRLAPDAATAPPSLFNGGLAREGLAEREAAVGKYKELLERFAQHELAREATFRVTRLDGFLERWTDLSAFADKLLAMKDLTILEAIEAEGAKGLALVEQDQGDDASRHVGKARDMIEQNRLGESGPPPIALAQVAFALGEVRRQKSEKITFDPVPASVGDALEQRCTGLLDAQSAYTDAMRSLDAHWSAMAGFRVGQLYQQLHRDVMRIPAPTGAKTLQQKQLFEGAMRLRYRVLLEKGLKMMSGTVALGARTGEDSAWILRAKQSKHDLELALEDERTALSKLPFTEKELQDALDKLKTVKP
jgi:tetratricopeptide (TPR) repeat protein